MFRVLAWILGDLAGRKSQWQTPQCIQNNPWLLSMVDLVTPFSSCGCFLESGWVLPVKQLVFPRQAQTCLKSAWAPHSLTEVSYPPVTLPQKARAILQARYWLNITKLLCDKIPKKQARYLHGALDRRTNPPTLLCLLQEPWASGSLSYGSILTLLQPFPSCCSLSYRLFKGPQSVHSKTRRTHYRAGKDILWKLQIMPRSCEPWSLVSIWEPLNSLGIIYLCIRHKICD